MEKVSEIQVREVNGGFISPSTVAIKLYVDFIKAIYIVR